VVQTEDATSLIHIVLTGSTTPAVKDAVSNLTMPFQRREGAFIACAVGAVAGGAVIDVQRGADFAVVTRLSISF
jgi:ABC-type Co2+ transport system permease subunit